MVPANNAVYGRQANTCAAELRRRMKSIECHKQFVDIPHIEADTVVTNLNSNPAPFSSRQHFDNSFFFFGAVFPGVRHQVLEGNTQHSAVAYNPHTRLYENFRWHIIADVLQFFRNFFQHLAQVYCLIFHGLSADAGQNKQPIDQPCHPYTGRADSLQVILTDLIQLIATILFQGLPKPFNGSQGLPEVMGDRVTERLQFTVGHAQLGGPGLDDALQAVTAFQDAAVLLLDGADHLVEGVTKGGASAVLAASIFHFGEFTIAEAKAHMAAAGIPMRLET